MNRSFSGTEILIPTHWQGLQAGFFISKMKVLGFAVVTSAALLKVFYSIPKNKYNSYTDKNVMKLNAK